MLTRIYIHNFRAFVNFEYRIGSCQLIIGSNGSGKSSFVDAISFIRSLIVIGDRPVEGVLEQRTRWLKLQSQVFEIEAILDGARYEYHVEIEERGNPGRPFIAHEYTQRDGERLFEVLGGELSIHRERGLPTVRLPFDGQRSAFGVAGPTNPMLGLFQNWLSTILIFRINPFAMVSYAQAEHLSPSVDLGNFVAWYRHLTQNDPIETTKFFASLRQVLPDFTQFKLEPSANNSRTLIARFQGAASSEVAVLFTELSEGQRCLICIYAILHFAIAKGGTVILDEPDNFIALRELQPWLVSVMDALNDAGGGQLLLISHHPEFINQWLSEFGVMFQREGMGPVRAKPFISDPGLTLSPAELVARGLIDE